MCHYHYPLWHMSHHFENRPIMFPDPVNIPLIAIIASINVASNARFIKSSMRLYRNPLWHMSDHFENGPIMFPDPEILPLAAISASVVALYCLE